MEHDNIDAHEAALRRLPEAHSLALRLKHAGVADEVVCGYLHIEPEGLDGCRARVIDCSTSSLTRLIRGNARPLTAVGILK